MKTMRTSCLSALLVLVGLVPNCWGFPGPPMTLDERWTDSSLVIYADVISASEAEFAQGQNAVLSAIKTLKSQPKGLPKEIRVFTLGGGCPYPFTFLKGQRIIAFLSYDADQKMYTPVGYPEGCFVVDEQSYKQYAGALKKLPAILGNADAKARDRLLLDWYVACATVAETRGDGTDGISTLRHRARHLGDPLTSAHKAQLAAALLSEKPPGKDAAAIASVLISYPSSKLDRYLLESLRRSHELGWRNLTRHAVDHLPKRLGIELNQATQQRLDEYWELLSLVYYKINRQAEPKRFERDKERMAILWGSLSLEIYNQCKTAIKSKK